MRVADRPASLAMQFGTQEFPALKLGKRMAGSLGLTASLGGQELKITPSHRDNVLERDGAFNDYQGLQWRSLLAESEESLQLSYAQSEKLFRETHAAANSIIERKWDVDS